MIMMDKLSDMGGSITAGGIVIALLIIAAIIGVIVFIKWRHSKKDRIPSTSRFMRNSSHTTIPEEEKQIQDTVDEYLVNIPEEKQEMGMVPAYIITLDGSLDFDYIMEPLGDVFMADTSMPKSGACYLVKETEGGEYEAYDPRTAPLLSDETPIIAWFATHWEIVREVYSVISPWWKSTSLWIAAITGLAAFIVVLATVGG